MPYSFRNTFKKDADTFIEDRGDDFIVARGDELFDILEVEFTELSVGFSAIHGLEDAWDFIEGCPWHEQRMLTLQQQYTDGIQKALDAFAQTRGYDGIMSCCSYADSVDPIFRSEAHYCIILRDTTWRQGYAIMDDVLSGKRPIPTLQELLDELPVGHAQWPEVSE